MLLSVVLVATGMAQGELGDGLAPEVTDLNAADVSYAHEQKLPGLDEPYLSGTPGALDDGIPVGDLGDRPAILALAHEIAAGRHGDIDSLLIAHRGSLVFESYYRRGRINYPHYQMSITKSYTAMAVGRAIQLGHLSMDDLGRPVVGFLKNLELGRLADGARTITLAQAMNMRSGIRISQAGAKALMQEPGRLEGQGQVQAYLEHSDPIPPAPREFKYQGADPSIAMQVLDAAVPGGARAFIDEEVLGKLGITSFAWQDDLSGLPKAAAGSSLRSRDMLKWGLLVLAGGEWQGEQLIPAEFVQLATSKAYTNPQGTSYGYFWWRHEVKVGGRHIDCRSARGAGGQFILIFPELELVAVVTAHHQGMGTSLERLPQRILPSFFGG